MRFKFLAAAVLMSTMGVTTPAGAAHHTVVGHRQLAPAPVTTYGYNLPSVVAMPLPLRPWSAQRSTAAARDLHRLQLEPAPHRDLHRLQLEPADELQLEVVEGQIGAVDGLLRFRPCVTIVGRGMAQHGAARLVGAARFFEINRPVFRSV